MSYIAGGNDSNSYSRGSNDRPGPLVEYFGTFTQLVRTHGLKGLVVLVIAAMLAFAPLTLLYWFNELRLASPQVHSSHRPVVVHSGQTQEEQEEEEPGETALLQVICETTSFGETRPLLVDRDPRHNRDGQQGSWNVNRERVYLRQVNDDLEIPFAMLGPPPISIWLPAGDYEIRVVHEAGGGEPRTDGRRRSFPFVTVAAECSLENKQRVVCRVPLPHFGFEQGFEPADAPDSLAPLIAAWENTPAVPTPNGYVMILPEPTVHHADDHRGCTIDFSHLHSEPREWTREQLARVRNWLPEDATVARAHLSSLVDALGWREMFAGWYCYVAAGVIGIIFTRWGAIAMLEPWRHGESFWDNVGLLCKVFFAAIAVWFLFCVLTDSGGCSGPVRFRLR